jgi:hypothetical protein
MYLEYISPTTIQAPYRRITGRPPAWSRDKASTPSLEMVEGAGGERPDGAKLFLEISRLVARLEIISIGDEIIGPLWE